MPAVSFRVPKTAELVAHRLRRQIISGELAEGEYELSLEDGRSGTVLVVSVKDGIARFRGLGPLA